MNINDIKNVTIVGGGTMGNGIVQVFASFGYKVTLVDLNQDVLDKAVAGISKSLDRFVKKEKISVEQKETTLSLISISTDLKSAKESQLVIEAVSENLAVKLKVFEQLELLCPPDAIFASNTSSLPITQLASATNRPAQFIGMHFMNPVQMMKLIELIRGMATSDETFKLIHELSEKLGKTPVEVNDFPGFIANRILLPMINEAVFALFEGVGTAEAIDNVMKLGMGHPMGPLQLADFIGLDVCLAILDVMHDGLGDQKYRPCPLLKKMVQAGYLGKKSGRGFYEYN